MNVLIMSVVLGAAASMVTSAQADTEETISKHFAVQPGGALVVNVEFGAVEIKPGSDSQATVSVWRKVQRGSKKDQEAFLRDRPVEMTYDDGILSIKSHPKTRSKWWSRGRMSAQAKYSITVPAQCDAKVTTAGGNVGVERLNGKVEARTAGGSLKLMQVQGNIVGNTSGGSIQTAQTEGQLSLNTSGGSIKVEKGTGSLECSTAGGSIGVADFKGAVNARTSGGSLSLSKVDGAVKGETTGGSITATLVSDAPEPVRLSSTGGSISLSVPAQISGEIDAEATGGTVHTAIPVVVAGKVERTRLKGTINGGGKPLVLRAVGGSVRIEKL